MNRIIITQFNDIMFLLLYEDDVLVECHPLMSTEGGGVQIGNIYLGRVQKKVKNINSAFITLDGKNVGYLPLDEKPALVLNRKLPKGLSSIAESDLILVQVEQEPQKMKQARVTGNINLSGKYAAVDMDAGKMGVSRKISDMETRERLKALLEAFVSDLFEQTEKKVLNDSKEQNDSTKQNNTEEQDIQKEQSDSKKKNNGYGYVLRTACENAPDSEIYGELAALTSQMDALIKRATYERRTGLLYGNKPEYITLIETYGIDRISEIKTDIPDVYETLLHYFRAANIDNTVASRDVENNNMLTFRDVDNQITSRADNSNNKPSESLTADKNDNQINISMYEDKNYPYYKLLGLETEIGKLLNKRVWLKSGGFLVIEPTEAMVVIDVNTGKSIGKKKHDAHILKVNLEAAAETARQLRLRNLSGIIMVDFINMESEEDKQKVIACLRREFARDKVSTHFIEITKLDVFEITRKKQRRPLHEILKYRENDLSVIE